jgi:hypothetical protein
MRWNRSDHSRHSPAKGEPQFSTPNQQEMIMDRTELQSRIDELMRQYQEREIDGDTYARKMMELTMAAQE